MSLSIKIFKTIALGISLVLTFHLSSQSIGFDFIYQPATYSLLSGVEVIQEPIHGFSFQSISKPQFEFQLYRKTKNNWSYGFGIFHNINSFYSSFNYEIPDGPFTDSAVLSNLFETRHLGINIFFGKQIGRFSISQYLGSANNYDFPTRIPNTIGGFGFDAYTSQQFIFEGEELVGSIHRLGATQYYVPKPNRGFGSSTATTKIGFLLVKDFEIGASLLVSSGPTVVDFKNFEEEQYIDGDESVSFIFNSKNRVGHVLISTDRLSWGIFFKYGLSKQLEQKGKQRRRKRREEKKS